MRAPTRAIKFTLCGLAVAVLGCRREQPIPTQEATPGTIAVVATAPAERVAAGEAKRGVGWYPAVAVDEHDRVHLAWTDADVGDVLYAASPAGAVHPGAPEPVESVGAAGGFVRLALAPGGAPVVSYYHQGDHTLKVAHRPRDVVDMKAAGAIVDDEPAPAPAFRAGAPGWALEEIAFGDEAGAEGALTVDAQGRVHLLYTTGGDRLRYARRPPDVPAFGAGGVGHWEKIDVDTVGPSPQVRADLRVLDDGTVVASYCDWQVVMSHWRLAVRAPGAVAFVITPARVEAKAGFDGVASALWRGSTGALDAAAVRLDDRSLTVARFDPTAPAPLEERARLTSARGPSVMRRAADGTVWLLTRDPHDVDAPGLFLVEVPQGDAGKARRTRLEKGAQDDAWIDLALRAGGRPVAVWFSEDGKALKLYAP
ncbi:MAG: hypothetical protein IT383_04340 [Deltaproteobacteria bacterium]|nr:hypothetical protein [Deltaproteobacteria bacterium]